MTLTIGGASYPIKSAELYVEFNADDRTATFSLYAETDQGATGVTINGQVLQGIADAAGLAGAIFRAAPHPEDEVPSIADCTAYEQGKVYDLKSLNIRFGESRNGALQIDLDAMAFELNEETYEQVGADRAVRLSCAAKLCSEKAS